MTGMGHRRRFKAMNKVMSLPVLICERCGHEWIPRKATSPTQCPKCKSPYWDRPRRG